MRNLDYHKNGHPPYEGDSVKKMLLSMIRNAKDLYNNLEDTDDLPEWISSELTKASYITSKTKDYILSKLEKKCMDGNLSESELKLIIKKHLISESINENLYNKIKSFIKPKEIKSSFSKKLYKKEFGKNLDSNHILNFLKSIKKVTLNINFVLKYFSYNEQSKNVFSSINEESLNKMTNILDLILKDINSFSMSKKRVKTTSARKKKNKSLKNLFGLLENENKRLFSKSLRGIQRDCLLFDMDYYDNIDYFNKSESAKNAYVEELLDLFKKEEVVQEINSMKTQIKNFLVLIEQLKTME